MCVVVIGGGKGRGVIESNIVTTKLTAMQQCAAIEMARTSLFRRFAFSLTAEGSITLKAGSCPHVWRKMERNERGKEKKNRA